MLPTEWWIENFGQYTPIGSVLRHHQPNNWLRFYSLPGAKRYANSAEEYKTLVGRHRQVADDLFEPGETCWIFKSERLWGSVAGAPSMPFAGLRFSSDYRVLPQYPGEVPPEDDDLYVVWYAEIIWSPPFFDDMVKAVADEEEFGMAIVSPATCNVYCPYDGGADVFCYSKPVRQMRERYRQWLSSRSDGL